MRSAHMNTCFRKMLNNQVIIVLIFTSFIIHVSTESIARDTQADLIIQGLENETWLDDETQCVQDTLNILYNVKNHTLWAVWIWNSMQSPTGAFYGSRYSLGNYDQCLNAPLVSGDPKVLTQYCLVDVKLTEQEGKKEGKFDALVTADEFFKIKSKAGRSFNIISWGTCLPASCTSHAVTKIVKTMYLVNPLAAGNPVITIDNCQVAGVKTVYSTQFYVFIAVMASLVFAALCSTIYLQYTTEDTRLTRVAYSFSLQRNWSSFTRITGDEIAILNFTKTIQVILITCTHQFMFLLFAAVGNGVDFDYYLTGKEYMLGSLILHIDLPCVENFLIISGLLVMKCLMTKERNPIISLIQRYIRLIGSFTFLVFYTMIVLKYTGDGPLWNKLVGKEHMACEQNWIWSLLMVNNFVNNERVCQLVSWYVQCDYQLAIMATVLYCIWQWNKRAGKVTTILACFLALVLPGVITYWQRIPGILLYDIDRFIDARTNIVYLDMYIKSHLRAGPYIMGMAVGYLMTIYKPTKYRGIISREWSYIGLIGAGILGLRVWTSAAAWCLGDYNPWNSAIFAAFNRNIWALSTCVCIIIAEYGDIPKIQSIIAWPGFTILNRLAYGVYMLHSLILQRNVFSQRNPMQYDMFSGIVNGLGVLVVSLVCALLLWLFVEAPLSNLTNLILAPRKQATANGLEKVKNMNEYTVIHTMKNGKHL